MCYHCFSDFDCMERDAIEKLEKWKNSPMRKPLILMGARQVGKTWLLQEFGARCFKNTAYIRFDLDEAVKRNFELDMNVKRLLAVIQIHAGFVINPKDTLIIFDEIQECPHAITSLKYFCEEAREYSIVAAGSLLGLCELHGSGFPVGKVDMMKLYPMSFNEFLAASGHSMLVELLKGGDKSLINGFSTKLTELLKTYYFVGGMPEVVNTYIKTNDFLQVRSVQRALIQGYRRDFSKHAPKQDTNLIRLIWDSISTQLSRENKKFVCKDVQPGMRMRQLESAMQWLVDAGLIYQVARVSKPSIPVAAYKERAFKLFYLDVGLLGAMCDLPAKVLLEQSKIFTEFKGALAEQYVQQELRVICDSEPVYWASDSNRAEIDFIVQHEGEIIPIEVKAETNLQSKSLKNYCRVFKPNVAVRMSLAAWNEQDMPINDEGMTCRLINLPLYCAHRMLRECCSS